MERTLPNLLHKSGDTVSGSHMNYSNALADIMQGLIGQHHKFATEYLAIY